MIAPTTLRELLRHHDWANERLLAQTAELREGQLDDARAGLPPLRALLHHLWAADRLWLDRWLEKPSPRMAEPEPGLGLREIAERFRSTAREREAFLIGARDEGESRRLEYLSAAGERHVHGLADVLLHVTNHGVHHRAQALAGLRAHGLKPRSVDFLIYKLAHPSVPLDPAAVEPLRAQGIDPGLEPAPPARFDLGTVRTYYRYSDWARDRLHAVIATLGDEQLDRRFAAGVGTLRQTLLHVRDAEELWLATWTGSGAESFRELPVSTTMAELAEHLAATASARNAFLDGLADQDLQRVVSAAPADSVPLGFRLGETMLQLCTHGAHHRGQVVTVLRHIGLEVPTFDYHLWLDSRAE